MQPKKKWFTFWSATILLLGLSSAASAAPITVCTPASGQDPAQCSLTRAVDFWFGTLSVQGVAAPNQDFFQSSDHFANSLALSLQNDGSVDPRVKAGLAAFTNLTGGIQWVLGALDNLPAQSNLAAAYTAADAALDALFGPGTLTLQGLNASVRNYSLGSVTTFCPIDSVPPACDGSGDELFELFTDFRAQVNMNEQNAVWARDTPGPTPVPEPSSIALFAVVLGAWVAVRRRKGDGT